MVEHSVVDWEESFEIHFFKIEADAQKLLKEHSSEIKENFENWEIEEDDENAFVSYMDGEYANNHFWLYVKEVELEEQED